LHPKQRYGTACSRLTLTIGEVGGRYVEHAKRRGRKVSTQKSIESRLTSRLRRRFDDPDADPADSPGAPMDAT
jgi:hypothetical protein